MLCQWLGLCALLSAPLGGANMLVSTGPPALIARTLRLLVTIPGWPDGAATWGAVQVPAGTVAFLCPSVPHVSHGQSPQWPVVSPGAVSAHVPLIPSAPMCTSAMFHSPLGPCPMRGHLCPRHCVPTAVLGLCTCSPWLVWAVGVWVALFACVKYTYCQQPWDSIAAPAIVHPVRWPCTSLCHRVHHPICSGSGRASDG
jgi:hypothetical protein